MDIAFKVLGSRWGAGKEIIENWRWEVGGGGVQSTERDSNSYVLPFRPLHPTPPLFTLTKARVND